MKDWKAVPQPAPAAKAASAILVLEDGSLFHGSGTGATGSVTGEVCFNTSMTGYQEIMTDPSYAGQLVAFTFPHIGNVGANGADMESARPAALGCIMAAPVTPPGNWRAEVHFADWLVQRGLIGIAGVDTRRLAARLRDGGAARATLWHGADDRKPDIDDLRARAVAWPGLEGMDLAARVTCRAPVAWTETCWRHGTGHGEATPGPEAHHVVAVDYGAKYNILRHLATGGCRVTLVPADMPAADILALQPAGIFLSNGPGDPAATGRYAVPIVRRLVESGLPIFGICLGHQILALALGGQTEKMHHGHHGANHPVRDNTTGRIEITSQNHGFAVRADSLPPAVAVTHRSLFDGCVEGLAVADRPIFSVQYHPEASPGPQDSHHLFRRFIDNMDKARAAA